MKKVLSIALCLFIVGINTTLKSQEMTEEQKISYAIGSNSWDNFKTSGVDVELDYLIQGMRDAKEGKNLFTQEEMMEIFQLLNQKMQLKQMQEVTTEKENGRIFLADNKKKEGVVETASQLQYKVIKMGDGAKPTETDEVRVHYHGTTLDGKVFDSSVERGTPASFPLNRVIKGWTEGVQLMPVGSKFIFYIPSDLAYGDRGAPPDIKPGATLIFEVELLEIIQK